MVDKLPTSTCAGFLDHQQHDKKDVSKTWTKKPRDLLNFPRFHCGLIWESFERFHHHPGNEGYTLQVENMEPKKWWCPSSQSRIPGCYFQVNHVSFPECSVNDTKKNGRPFSEGSKSILAKEPWWRVLLLETEAEGDFHFLSPISCRSIEERMDLLHTIIKSTNFTKIQRKNMTCFINLMVFYNPTTPPKKNKMTTT